MSCAAGARLDERARPGHRVTFARPRMQLRRESGAHLSGRGPSSRRTAPSIGCEKVAEIGPLRKPSAPFLRPFLGGDSEPSEPSAPERPGLDPEIAARGGAEARGDDELAPRRGEEDLPVREAQEGEEGAVRSGSSSLETSSSRRMGSTPARRGDGRGLRGLERQGERPVLPLRPDEPDAPRRWRGPACPTSGWRGHGPDRAARWSVPM